MKDSIKFDESLPFEAAAPHALDGPSLRRVSEGMSWLRRVARESEDSPFAVQQLTGGHVPILIHAHLVADSGLILAIVSRYARWISDQPERPGFVVLLPGLSRNAGGSIQHAGRELQELLGADAMRVGVAGPGVHDFAHVGKRGAPTALITVAQN